MRRWWKERRAASIGILAGGAAVLLVLVLLATGVLGGDGIFGGDDDSASAEDAPELLGYPLAPLEPDKDNAIKGALPIDQIGLTVLSRSQTVQLALSSNEELSPALTSALQQGQPVIEFQGTSVLTGDLADAQSNQQELQLELEATDSEATGEMTIRAEDEQPVIDLRIENLEPAPEDQTYVLWAVLPEGTELPAPSETPAPEGGGAVPAPGGGGGGGGAGGGSGGGGGG
jgi:hypothetical protein